MIGLIRLGEEFNAEKITASLMPLLDCLKQYGVMVRITADGASVLAGQFTGVAKRLQEVYPYAVHIHCTAHRLNLVLGSLAKKVMAGTLRLLKSLHTCFNAGKLSDTFEKVQIERKFSIRKISGYIELRWVSLSALANVSVERYHCMLIAIYQCGQGNDNQSTTCAGLYHKLSQYNTLIEIVIFNEVMCLLEALSKMLQSSTINWHQVCGEVRTQQNIIEGLCESQQYIDSCTKVIEKDCRRLCHSCQQC